MITEKIPIPDVIEPDSPEAEDAVRGRWIRAWHRMNPELKICPLDSVDPNEWATTETAPIDLENQ